MPETAKKAAAKKAEDETPDVSDVRITTKYDSELDDERADGITMRRYTFADGTTAKAWKFPGTDLWSVAVANAAGRTLSGGHASDLSVEAANVRIEQAGIQAEANAAKREAMSD